MQYFPTTETTHTSRRTDSFDLPSEPLSDGARTAFDAITRLIGTPSIAPNGEHAIAVEPRSRIAARSVVASAFESRNLNSALRIVYFAHPRQKHVTESAVAIDATPLPSSIKGALKTLVAGPLQIGREDSKSMAKQRSARLTCGQIAADMIAHIDNLLETRQTLQSQDGDAGSHALSAEGHVLSAAEIKELELYKRVLLFFQKTTSFDTVLSGDDIQRCLDEDGICVVHDNDFGKDAHSQAVLFVNEPPQLMSLNDLTSEIRPVAQSQGLKLQWNKLYVVLMAKNSGWVYTLAAANYNARAPMLNANVLSYCRQANKAEYQNHPLPLYGRQFTRPIVGYGCAFKTIDDMEGVILSSDLRSKLQRHLQVLALLALKQKNLVPNQPIPEEKIWSVDDAPKRRLN